MNEYVHTMYLPLYIHICTYFRKAVLCFYLELKNFAINIGTL